MSTYLVAIGIETEHAIKQETAMAMWKIGDRFHAVAGPRRYQLDVTVDAPTIGDSIQWVSERAQQVVAAEPANLAVVVSASSSLQSETQ